MKFTTTEQIKIHHVKDLISFIDKVIEKKRKPIEELEREKFKQEMIISRINEKAAKRCKHIETYQKKCFRDDCATGYHTVCKECGNRV